MQDHDSTIYRSAGGDSLMGVKLMVEILDHWQDAGLTRGERDDLLIIAENANDGSRETYSPIHEDYILRRAGKQSQSWRNSIDVLKRKGVLEYAIDKAGRQMSGRPGRFAKYRIPILCPDAPHDGYRGQCTRKERVLPQGTHSEWVTGESTHMGTPGEYPSIHLGAPGDAEWVTGESTPTPPNPSNKISPQEPPPPAPGAVHPDWLAEAEEGAGVQGEGEGWETQPNTEAASPVVDSVADDPLMHQAVLFVDKLPFDQRPTSSERTKLVDLAALWLAAGWTHEALMAKCESNLGNVRSRIDVWTNHRLPAHRVTKPPSPTANGHRAYSDPNASAYRPPKEHIGWQNPTDPDAYEGTF